MGLEAFSFNLLNDKILPQYKNPKVLSLGVPEIFVPEGVLPEKYKCTDPNTIRRHGNQVPYDGVGILREHLGLDIKFLEHTNLPGTDIIHDLNWPFLEGQEKRIFDVVIDPGTFEHIFNIASAFRSMNKALAVGGRILHTNPLNRPNHGFWSLSPTAYKDYYEANGYEIEELVLWGGLYATPQVIDIKAHPYERFPVKGEASVCAIAHKTTHILDTWPIQWKYRQ